MPTPVPDNQAVLLSDLIGGADECGLIGLAGALIQDGQIVAEGACGSRRKSNDDPVKPDDTFHIGSVGKTMAAMVIMRLVERGLLDLDQPVSRYLTDYCIHESWATVTLRDLLLHKAGIQRDFPGPVFQERTAFDDRIAADRREALRQVLAGKIDPTPGGLTSYSNVGFTLLGHIAGLVTRKSWETVLRDEIWKPLGLTSAGFGPPRSDSSREQPRGHRPFFYRGELWGIPSMGPMREQDPTDPGSDLAAINRPAGLAHMNMQDLARFGHEYMKGMRGKSQFLREESFKFLLKPEIEVSKGIKLTNGSFVVDDNVMMKSQSRHTYSVTGWNTSFVGFLALFPDQNAVLALASNDGRLSRAYRLFTDISQTASLVLQERASRSTRSKVNEKTHDHDVD